MFDRKIKIFGKSVPLALVVVVAIAGIGSAALIGSFVTASGTATVEQSIVYNTTANTTADDTVAYESRTEARLNLNNDTFVAGQDVNETFTLENVGPQTETVKVVIEADGPGINDPYEQEPISVTEVAGISAVYSITGEEDLSSAQDVRTITLDPGEQAEVGVSIRTDPALRPGDYEITVKVQPA